MESVEHLKDEEIIYVLRRIGIRQKPELDIALAEYKKYWKTISLAKLSSDNDRGSFVKTTGRKD